MNEVLFEDVQTLSGSEQGSVSIVLAGVHGNEVCGVEAFRALLPTLQIKRGTVFFAYGNPRAIVENKRFTEANLNRMFYEEALTEADRKTYEYARASFLKPWLDKADALLDIHASFTKDSTPFVICEANAKFISDVLPIQKVVSGFDEHEPGGTDYHMNKKGGIGVCVECGYLAEPRSLETAKESLLRFLAVRGHIDAPVRQEQHTSLHVFTLYKAKTDRFELDHAFADFEKLERGALIGKDSGQEVRAPELAVILFATSTRKAGDEAFLLARELRD